MPSGPRDNSSGISRLIAGFCPLVISTCQTSVKWSLNTNQKCRYCACINTSPVTYREDAHPSSRMEAANRSCQLVWLAGLQTKCLNRCVCFMLLPLLRFLVSGFLSDSWICGFSHGKKSRLIGACMVTLDPNSIASPPKPHALTFLFWSSRPSSHSSHNA